MICCKKLLGTKPFSILHSFRPWHLVKLAIYYAMHKKLNLVLLPPPFPLTCLEARGGKLPFLPFTSHRAKRKQRRQLRILFCFSPSCACLSKKSSLLPFTRHREKQRREPGSSSNEPTRQTSELLREKMEEQERRWVK